MRASLRALTYPLTQYQCDPVGYAHRRLGIRSFIPHQERIMRAVAAAVSGTAAARVAVSSGQKCGKTLTVVVLALWFYECFPSSRVFLTAAIELQLKNVLWKELGNVLRTARAAGADIDGRMAASPVGGLTSSDGSREIKGILGREIESLAGLSGNMLTIVDEASALPEAKAQVFAGNQMGGGSQLWISNPTRGDGPFFEAFHRAREFWQTFEVDGEDVARWQDETGIRIPFTVNSQKIREMAEIYGVDSPFYQVRVKGRFLRNETGRAIQFHQIEEAIARWEGMPEEGLLTIGYDPAGPGDAGDEHAWAVVRGAKCLALFPMRGLDEEPALAMTYSLLTMHRRGPEVPTVNIDAEGPIGSVLHARLRAEAERRRLHDKGNLFDVVGVKSSSKVVRDPQKFQRVRDELIWTLAEWIATAGIPRDDKLQSELHEPIWTSTPSGQITSTPKSAIREKLGRSPDRFDALALAVHRTATWIPDLSRRTTDSYVGRDEIERATLYGDEAFGGYGDQAFGAPRRGEDE